MPLCVSRFPFPTFQEIENPDSDLIDAVAQKTGKDSHEIRRRGFVLTSRPLLGRIVVGTQRLTKAGQRYWRDASMVSSSSSDIWL